MEKILFLTGRLAQVNLQKVLASITPPSFSWEIKEIGLQVAGLMTSDMIMRRLKSYNYNTFDKIIVPGRCRGDLKKLSLDLGIEIIRGPEEMKDIPKFFNKKSFSPVISAYDILIFAEIVDATKLSIDQILTKATDFKNLGANVIDLGCLPETEFSHLEESIKILKENDFKVSVDSLKAEELIRGGNAGADYLLSLTPKNLWIADEVESIPILIPNEPSDEKSLFSSIEILLGKKKKFFADSILDPIPFGCLESLCRYKRLREKFPNIDILVGVGNITELIDTDTNGVNTFLLGLCSELNVTGVLTTQVSNHARRVIREIDIARKLMYVSREMQCLPKNITDELLTIHEKNPFLDTKEEIEETAKGVKDPNFRIQISNNGLYVYNRDGLRSAKDPFAFYPKLQLESDSSHAFYMGVELARAEVAWRLGKRYSQDKGLYWGVAEEPRTEDYLTHCQPTIKTKIRNLKK